MRKICILLLLVESSVIKNLSIYMEFRKMVTITLYVRQQKRHRCIEQSLGLCGRGRGWDDLGEWHWNMYIITCETNHQSRFDVGYRMLGAGALRWPREMIWGERWEGGSGLGTHVHLWRIQSMYGKTNTVLESKIKILKNFKKNTFESVLMR